MFYLDKPINFPAEIDSHLQRVFLPSKSYEIEISKYSKALPKLWQKLAVDRGQKTEGHYSFQTLEAQTYAAYYMPANCLKVPLVLEEAFLLNLDLCAPTQNIWLDFGTGPGTAFLGLRWWLEKRNKSIKFYGFDQSNTFLKIAESLSTGSTSQISAKFQNSKKLSAQKSIDDLNPTHISFINSLAEIYPDLKERTEKIEEILSQLKRLNKKDSKDRFLIIIEPGSKQSSRELAQLKDSLGKENYEVILPCLNNRKCGALKRNEDWCHEEVACNFPDWLQEIGSAAEMKKESILFSYVVFKVSQKSRITEFESRIVSQRLDRKGQTECWICKNEGKILARAQKSKLNEYSDLVTFARRGDLWRNLRLAEKGDLLEAIKAEGIEPTIF
jgi:hypothetical protein